VAELDLFPGRLWSVSNPNAVSGPHFHPVILISIQKLKKASVNHWFTVVLLAAVGLAALIPDSEQVLNPGGNTRIGIIILIFFLTGLNLQSSEVIRGFIQWKIHLAVQAFIYGIFPLVSWILIQPFREILGDELLTGYVLLIILPTTITSCVVFTELSGGNTPVALFNAIFGNFIGLFLTPCLLLFVLGASIPGLEIDVPVIIVRIVKLTILPFLVGQMVKWILKVGRQPWIKYANSAGIILIVFLSFCRTFGTDQSVLSLKIFVLLLVFLTVLHFLMLVGSWAWGALFGFERDVKIAVLFCCSQKTLALGIPLISACLEFKPEWMGYVSIPLIIYHAIQLTVSSFARGYLAGKSRRTDD
jgi:sodium/bile acid cotransporter 7